MMDFREQIIPESDLREENRTIWIITTASLPWMTGSANSTELNQYKAFIPACCYCNDINLPFRRYQCEPAIASRVSCEGQTGGQGPSADPVGDGGVSEVDIPAGHPLPDPRGAARLSEGLAGARRAAAAGRRQTRHRILRRKVGSYYRLTCRDMPTNMPTYITTHSTLT